MPSSPADRPPIVTAVDMGYGHLRAAHALADALGTEVVRADLPPLASPGERRLWNALRAGYEAVSRGSQGGPLAPVLRPALERLTRIGTESPPRGLTALLHRGAGAGPARAAARAGVPLLSTYFVPPLAADHLDGAAPPAWCVVTDTDLARAWVASEPRASAVRYLVPTEPAERRLLEYGVPAGRIEHTGFPLPGALLGGPELPALRENLEARLRRLEGVGGPVHLAYTVGGAGAQAELARQLLAGLRPLIVSGALRLTLVAGVRERVAERFRGWVRRAGLPSERVSVLVEPTPAAYFRSFDRLLAETDLLWTKPSELTFFAALGLPLLLAPPVGEQERCNRRWLREHGAALEPPERALERETAPWLSRALEGGTLARTARAGFENLPKRGLYRIVERVTEGPAIVG